MAVMKRRGNKLGLIVIWALLAAVTLWLCSKGPGVSP